MEAISATQAPGDHQRKHVKTPRRFPNHTNHRSFNLKPSNGIALGGGGGGAGVLFGPSADPYYSLLLANVSNNLGCYAQPPPPLLPFPSLPAAAKPYNIKALSYPPPNNNMMVGKPRFSSSSSLTPKKSSPKSKHPHLKKEQKNGPRAKPSVTPVIGSTGCTGPKPGELPRDVFVSKGNSHSGKHDMAGLITSAENGEFSGPSLYNLAPPPSSLPLPRFSLRPKLGCKAEAAAAGVAVDSGAGDSLRQMLRLP